MAPTTLPPAERPRVTPPWPRSPSCRTRNPHNVVGGVGILRPARPTGADAGAGSRRQAAPPPGAQMACVAGLASAIPLIALSDYGSLC